MKATKNTYVRQYPRQPKRGDKHNLEDDIFQDSTPASNAAAKSGRGWTRKHFAPAYNFKPESITESPLPESKLDLTPSPRDRSKPTDQYVWKPVHTRQTDSGELIILSNSRGEFTYRLGKFESSSVYSNRDSVIRAINGHAARQVAAESVTPVSHFSDDYEPGDSAPARF